MKKPILHFFYALFVSTFFLFNSCSSNDLEPNTAWTEADKQSHDQVLNVQDQIGENLDGWFQTMDSLDAIQEAYNAFRNSEYVSSATINSQGIAVQFTNGMRGGLFLNPKDDKGEVGETLFKYTQPEADNGLKSLVNNKKMILINPHYFERSYYTDQIYNITSGKLGKVGMQLTTFYKNQEATVDRFTELAGYGIIQIYSHGWAWPKQENITDVYLLTGESANNATSAKYWDELKTGNIPIIKVAGSNKYLIAPRFIMEHNDFSKDTVLFFGGFCYSFLGDWPDIIDGFADGAYLGYDWSVYTHKNANWSVNSIAKMCDTSLVSPMTLEGWMQDPDVEKSYWNEKDNRTVHIHYTGDGNLKLWDDVSVSLKALSIDGAPVTKPGEANVAYPFRCTVNTSISSLEYVWDIGDGSSPATTQGNEVNITWSEDGNYLLSMTVKNKNTGASIGNAKLNITIGSNNNEIIEIAQSCDYTVFYLRPGSAIIENYGFTDVIFTIDNLVWNGLNFSGATTYNNVMTHSISGTLSSNGQTVSFTAVQEGEVLGYNMQRKLAITVENYPLKTYQYNQIVYEVDPPGDASYVTNFDGYITQGGNTTYLTTSDFRWSVLQEFYIRFNKPN